MAEYKHLVDLLVDGDVTALEANLLAINFDTASASPTPLSGQLVWNSDESTLNLHLNSNVTAQLGQEAFFYVKNLTGSTIANGTPIMFNGSVGASGRIQVVKAIADGTYEPDTIVGITTEDIPTGSDGFSTWFGKTRGIDTSGTPYGETWVVGDIIYVSGTTAGYLTKVQPLAPNQGISMAVVVVASATVGELLVRPTWSHRLDQLSDVNGTTPLSDYVLAWNNTSSYWDATALTESMISDFGTYDNYQYWTLKTNGTFRTTIVGNDAGTGNKELDLVADPGIGIAYSANGVVTISNTAVVPDLQEVTTAGNTTGDILNIGSKLTLLNTGQYVEAGVNSIGLRSTGVVSMYAASTTWLSLHATGMNFSSTGGLDANTVTLKTNLITLHRYFEFPNKDGTFAMTSDLIANTDTTYTHDAIVDANGAILRLIGSDATNDDILLKEGTGIDITQNTTGQITITNTGSNVYTISQTGLGTLVSVNKLIYQDASGWGLANATDDTKVAAGIVKSIEDNDTITYQASGEFAYVGGTLTVGSVYWLAATDGNSTATEPITNYIQPVFQALSATLALLTFEPMLVYTDATNYFGVEEAPLDGQQYGRQSAAWTVITAAGAMTSFDIEANDLLTKTISDGEIVNFVDGIGTIASIPVSLGNDVTFNIDYTGSASTNLIDGATNHTITLATTDQILFKDTGSGDVRRTNISYLPFTDNDGTITGVNITAGDGLTGTVDTTSGQHTQTLNVVTGTSSGLLANVDNIAINYAGTNSFIKTLFETTNLGDGDSMVFYDLSLSTSREVLFSNIKITDLDDSNIMYDNIENSYTKTQYFNLTSGTTTILTYPIDFSSNQVHQIALTNNINISYSNAKAGATYIIIIKQATTGSLYTVGWPSDFRFPDNVEPVMTQTLGKVDVYTFVATATNRLYSSYNQNYEGGILG